MTKKTKIISMASTVYFRNGSPKLRFTHPYEEKIHSDIAFDAYLGDLNKDLEVWFLIVSQMEHMSLKNL